ncbi:uncharacterized protein AB675_149 [Cyphellophora attinorum]|uniref:Uncharacterized protein n=1 Tax=Cyphellophora attinorum TaxID=1664694 RepID=A0A0N1NYZ2_9EURO|nr:uncharacterized protein AB675_149 [Phialophora attinorum]KPI37812.1 hypothetical protein AB675_149 [Phialophora attinorum]
MGRDQNSQNFAWVGGQDPCTKAVFIGDGCNEVRQFKDNPNLLFEVRGCGILDPITNSERTREIWTFGADQTADQATLLSSCNVVAPPRLGCGFFSDKNFIQNFGCDF